MYRSCYHVQITLACISNQMSLLIHVNNIRFIPSVALFVRINQIFTMVCLAMYMTRYQFAR